MNELHPQPAPDDEAIADAAALWLAEREEGFTPARARAFEAWHREDSRHRAAFAQMVAAEALLQRLPEARVRLADEVVSPWAAGWRLLTGWHGRMAAVAAALVLGALAWWPTARPLAPEPLSYATAAGGYQSFRLADGSILELNADSEATVQIAAHERRVTLRRGEAHFRVVRDAARPFVVAAAGVQVRAVGTAFNVRLAGADVAVLVTEGKVQVDPAPGAKDPGADAGVRALLVARERTVVLATPRGAVPAPLRVEQVTAEGVREELSWQERKLVFRETPLRDVIAQFNRHNVVQLKIGDAELAARPVGGTFAADNVGVFVRLFEESGDIVAERRGEREIVLRRAR